MLGMNLDLSKLIVNFDTVENVFIDAVVEQAEIRNVQPNTLALRIFPQKLQHIDDYGSMVRVSSVVEEFNDEIIELSELTIYDSGKHISQAFMNVFKHEVIDHNATIGIGGQIESTKNFPNLIDLEKLEMWVMVKPIQDQKKKWDLDMNVIYNFKRLRPYVLREEFSELMGK